MIRCLAVDDEPLALELLEDNISKLPYLHRVASCSNAIEATQVLQREPVDLIFLDIQMPGLSGLQFIQTLSVPPMVIMVTAYEKYALEGFNYNVVDYLVKPVPLERFLKACNKARELFELRKSSREGDAPQQHFFFVPVDYSLLKVLFDDILYIEGLKDYVKIHLASTSRPVVTRMSLKSLEDQLPPKQFIRIHKSYIVSVNHLTSVRRSSVAIGKVELPVTDLYREGLDRLIGK